MGLNSYRIRNYNTAWPLLYRQSCTKSAAQTPQIFLKKTMGIDIFNSVTSYSHTIPNSAVFTRMLV